MHNFEKVFGIETEYTMTVDYPGAAASDFRGSCHDAQQPICRLPEKSPTHLLRQEQVLGYLGRFGIVAAEDYLSNGGRFYFDISGPEYCTPETRTVEEAVERSFDGDYLVYSAFLDLVDDGVLNAFQFNRRSADHAGQSRGMHLNISVPDYLSLITDTSEMVDLHSSLNVAKAALLGSGGLMIDEDGITKFFHSPRLALSAELDSTGSTGSVKPLYRSLVKGDNGVGRLETVTTDALNFPWPLKASMVLTEALQDLINEGVTDGLPRIQDPECISLWVGEHGPEACVDVDLPDGGQQTITALDLLMTYATDFLRINEIKPVFRDEVVRTLQETIDVGNRYKRDPINAATQVESVARLFALNRKLEDRGAPIDSEIACKFDFYWDKIGGGLAERLRESNKAGRLGFKQPHSGRARSKRLAAPPNDTRAAIRSQLIKQGGLHLVNWHYVGDEQGKRHLTPHGNVIPEDSYLDPNK
ncbi:MAG: proteasome accessory factor PafA2 family protein [bacterium]|nr:proteasome accessory factor PafA2 family protein [bacterium]